MKINIPLQKNEKLAKIVAACEESAQLEAMLKASNVMLMDRLNFSDHGPTHARIASNLALRLLRMLHAAGVEPDLVKYHKKTQDDAEVVVFLGTMLHDLGNTVHREGHEDFSVTLATGLLPGFLGSVYSGADRAVMQGEILHCIASHEKRKAVSIEAGCVKVGDALNMTEGRSWIPFKAGTVNIHSVSAQAVKSIELVQQTGGKPIKIMVHLSNSAGIFQVDNLLREKLASSSIEQYVQVIAEVSGEKEKKIIEEYKF